MKLTGRAPLGLAEFKEELKWEWSWLAEWRSAHGKAGGLTVTVAMTREEERLETCGVRGQLRGEADGGGPRPRESGVETRACDWAWVWPGVVNR